MAIKKTSILRSRFNKGPEKAVENFIASIPFDRRLYRQDIEGSSAHVQMLAKQNIISQKDSSQIINGLNKIQREIESGTFVFKVEYEDIHMNIEKRLFEIIGDVAGKLHTARSRNDQIALDIRLYMKEVILNTINEIQGFQQILVNVADDNSDVIMPGYTHLQQAQPIILSHYLLAYFEMLQRDIGRFKECYIRTDICPLGSGALAGTTYNIDRNYVAKLLNFSRISANSLDAVSDRDFILDYVYASSLTMMHLSRFAEDVIIWSTAEFNYIEIDDAYATSSSIMPQKKNPDVAELIRGKCGRVYGGLTGLLTIMKALPLTYNRDLQEDKEILFNVIDTVISCVSIFTQLLATAKFNKKNMYNSALRNYILATDIADYLVTKGLTFRKSHEIVANLVKYLITENKVFNELKLADYKKFSSKFDKDVFNITLEKSVAARNNTGGTAPIKVRQAIRKARELLNS